MQVSDIVTSNIGEKAGEPKKPSIFKIWQKLKTENKSIGHIATRVSSETAKQPCLAFGVSLPKLKSILENVGATDFPSRYLGAMNLNLMPGVPYSYMRLAQIYEFKKNWKAWQKIMLECIKNNPDYPLPYIKVAKHIQTNTGKTEDAINLLQKGKEHNPDSPQLINSLAWIYLENNINPNEAFFLAQKAYDLQPNDPSIADTLGWVYYKKKHYTRAGWLISQAESLAPDNPIVKYHSGMISLAKGKKKQAMQIFTKAVESGLSNPEFKEVKNIISQIESTTLVFTMDVLPVQLWTCRLLFLTFLEPGLNYTNIRSVCYGADTSADPARNRSTNQASPQTG